MNWIWRAFVLLCLLTNHPKIFMTLKCTWDFSVRMSQELKHRINECLSQEIMIKVSTRPEPLKGPLEARFACTARSIDW